MPLGPYNENTNLYCEAIVKANDVNGRYKKQDEAKRA